MNCHPSRNLRAACASEAGRCLAEALQTRWRSYRERLRRCQKDFSEEEVHELRVATRRLIAQLVLLSCVIRSASLEKARRILKRRMVALGELRDVQVQRACIADQAARFPELVLMLAWLQRRERRLAKSAVKQVRGFKTKKLEKWVYALSDDLRGKSRGARAQRRLAPAVLGATANAFAEAVARRRAIDLADLGTIHQTRVAFKRFRYMVESLSPGITGLSKRQLRALAHYQRKMGIIQDLEVLQACVTRVIREHQKAEALLRPFDRYLRQRRARALRSFLRSADRLFEFWPPVKLMTVSDLVVTRSAA
jgi:CHAD domain-containing protein